MRRIVMIAASMVVVGVGVAEAGPLRGRSVTRTQSCTTGQCGSVVESTAARTVTRGRSAQGNAEMMASSDSLRHMGGHDGGHEGIGFSSTSPDDAVRRSCYWGRLRVREIGVARGPRGWYAAVWYD